MKKKGIQLGEAFAAVLMLTLVAMLIIIAIYMFVVLQNTVPLTSQSAYNEAVTMRGPTVSVLTNSSLCRFTGLTINQVTNGTSLVGSGNYTVNSTGIANTTGTYAGVWYVNYSFQWGDDTCVASQTMITQFGTFPALLGLVGTIIFLGIVIGVLVASFVLRSKRGA